MRSHIFVIYVLPFFAIELIAMLVTVLMIVKKSDSQNESRFERFVHHQHRVWMAAALFFLPLIAARLFTMWWMRHLSADNHQVQLCLSAVLNVFNGIVFGLIGCLLAASGQCGGALKRAQAIYIGIGFTILFAALRYSFGPVGFARNFYLPEIVAALVFAVLLIARAFPSKPVDPTDDKSGKTTESPVFALSLAFLPSAMLLLLWTLFAAGAGSAGGQPPPALFIVCCFISIVCCFAASFMLFRRGTGFAILGGIVFMVLNALISFFFGCGAILTQMRF